MGEHCPRVVQLPVKPVGPSPLVELIFAMPARQYDVGWECLLESYMLGPTAPPVFSIGPNSELTLTSLLTL